MNILEFGDDSPIKKLYDSWNGRSDQNGRSNQTDPPGIHEKEFTRKKSKRFSNQTDPPGIHYKNYREYRRNQHGEIFSCIYSFSVVVDAIDSEIEKKINENEKIEIKITLNGTTMNYENVSSPKTYRKFREKWDTLSDIHFNEHDCEKLGITFEQIMQMRLAQYRGFIDALCMMIEKGKIYYE